MIFHRLDAGVIRTQPQNSDVFECQLCHTTWTSKLDLWQDCVPHRDEPNGATTSSDVAIVTKLRPVRDPDLPRMGVVDVPVPAVDPPGPVDPLGPMTPVVPVRARKR